MLYTFNRDKNIDTHFLFKSVNKYLNIYSYILIFCAQKRSSSIYVKFQGHNQDLERQLVHNVLPAPTVYNWIPMPEMPMDARIVHV